MKKTILILQLMISLTIFSQQNKTEINSIDTLKLGDFKHKKVVLYVFENAKICITANDYLSGVKVFHKNYRKLILESKKEDLSYEFYKRSFETIDSIYKSVRNEIKTKDTIIINHKIFDKTELGSLVNFENFIEKGNCAIYDEKGKRQNKIIRKKESYYIDPENAWGGRKFYLINTKKFFFQCTDIVS